MDAKPSRQREQQIDDGQETSQTKLHVDNHQEETESETKTERQMEHQIDDDGQHISQTKLNVDNHQEETETETEEYKTSWDADLSCPTCGTNNCELNGCPEASEIFDEI